MAHLVILDGPDAFKRVPLEKDKTVLGRADSVDLTIPDRNASSSHCRIERTPQGFRVLDLESQNGTWLNGRRVRRHDLKAGDVISVGTTEIRFELPQDVQRRRPVQVTRALEELETALQSLWSLTDGAEAARAVEELRNRSPQFAAALQDPEMMRLRKLVSWIRRLTNERDHNRLLSLMLDSVVELTGAERGFLMLLEGKEPNIRVARDFDLAALRKPTFKVARGLAEKVARTGQAIVSTHADEDPHIKSFGDTGALHLRSVACVPIRAGDRVLGSLYLDNRFERGALTPEDLPFLLSFADQAAIALENARLHAEARRSRREVEELNRALRGRVEEQEKELHEVKTLYAHASAEARTKYSYDAIVGRSPAIKELFFMLDRVTDSDIPVFLHGESGTGKELAARAIHFNGPRGSAPFVAENCAAIPETLFESELFGYVKGAFTGAAGDKKGLFELAHEGTLFLDEVADMPLAMQAKLLRVLEEHEIRPVGGKRMIPVDVRILTASNKDLAEQVRRGRFREDLYHRIHVIEVEVPPLRRRREDIPLLVEHFLARAARGQGLATPKRFSKSALELVMRHDWPGNVRELGNEVLRAHTLSDADITPESLSDALRAGAGSLGPGYPGSTLKDAVREATREVERELITSALRMEKGNKSAAARRLGVSRPTLDSKMELLKIPRHPA